MGSREKRGPLALELWAKQLTQGYPNVAVRNMTTSWRNGLAFCALIHRFRPDLIDYEKLDPADIIGNCSLAFEVAESKLGIPALLDPEDMEKHEVPDRLSVLTYVAQFYSAFKSSDPLKMKTNYSPNASQVLRSTPEESPKTSSTDKTRMTDAESDAIIESARHHTPRRSVLLSSPTVCSTCSNPVYISERVLFLKRVYHRSCFRCSNCQSLLNPHTAELSPDGYLYCVEILCARELAKKSRQSALDAQESRMISDVSGPESSISDLQGGMSDLTLEIVDEAIKGAEKPPQGPEEDPQGPGELQETPEGEESSAASLDATRGSSLGFNHEVHDSGNSSLCEETVEIGASPALTHETRLELTPSSENISLSVEELQKSEETKPEDENEEFEILPESKNEDEDVLNVLERVADLAEASFGPKVTVKTELEEDEVENTPKREIKSFQEQELGSCTPPPIPKRRKSPRPGSHRAKDGDCKSLHEIYKKKNYYPTELNPFESDVSLCVGEYPFGGAKSEPKNPFEDAGDEEAENNNVEGPETPKTPKNPFEDDEGDEKIREKPKLKARKSKRAPLPPPLRPPPPVKTDKIPPPLPETPPPRKESKEIIDPTPPDLLKGLDEKNRAKGAYKKKRRAPPPRRRVEPLPEEAIRVEKRDLEVKERELERQGIKLEADIRRRLELREEEESGVPEEDPGRDPGSDGMVLDVVDEMIVQLWAIINEKNEILRRQTELEYLRRSHRLEELQAETEFQLRILMNTPAEQRQDDHEQVEALLLEQLLKTVDERNEVVDWLDYHRKMDREEDVRVSQSLTAFTSPTPPPEPLSKPSKPFSSSKVVLPIPTGSGSLKKLKAKMSKKSKKDKEKDGKDPKEPKESKEKPPKESKDKEKPPKDKDKPPKDKEPKEKGSAKVKGSLFGKKWMPKSSGKDKDGKEAKESEDKT